MAVVTVGDVLRHAKDFEQAIADFYSRLSQQTSLDGVRLLADYMSRHRARVAWALDCLPSEHVQRMCSAPLRYEPQGADCRCFERIELPPATTAASVLETAVTFSECLVKLYRQVVQQPLDEEVREFFESFIRLEHREEIELKKIQAMDYF
jgi:hypothetical protein